MTNRLGRNAALVAGAALTSAILVFAGANPAAAPEINELSLSHTGTSMHSARFANSVEPVALAASFSPVETTPAPVMPTGDRITAIGDSLMVGATPFLEELFPGISIDGRVGRPMPEGMDILDELLAQGAVGDYVVLGLATNAGVTVAQFDEIITEIGPDRTLIVVNAWGDRSWIPGGNDEIAQADAKYGTQLVVADWYNLILDNQELIGPDGIHANDAGKQAYANLVLNTIETAINQ